MNDSVGEIFDLIQNRKDIVEYLAIGFRDRRSLQAQSGYSRATVERCLDDLVSSGLAQASKEGFEMTLVGRLLYQSYQRLLLSEWSEEQIRVAKMRINILKKLNSNSKYNRDLVEILQCSRSTVSKALRKMNELGFVARTSTGWETTTEGSRVLSQITQFITQSSTILSARSVLSYLPRNFDLPTRILLDSKVINLDDRTQLFPYIYQDLRTADSCSAVLPRMVDSRHIRMYHRKIINDISQIELTMPSESLIRIREEFPKLSRKLAEASGFTANAGETPPVGIITTLSETDTDKTTCQRRRTIIIAYDSEPVGLLRVYGARGAQWGELYCKSVKSKCTEVTDDLARGSTVPVGNGERERAQHPE